MLATNTLITIFVNTIMLHVTTFQVDTYTGHNQKFKQQFNKMRGV